MRKIRVLFHGSCWPTNIGNAFVNLGAIYSLKSALRTDGSVFHVGGMSGYLFNINRKRANSLPFGEIVDCDYLVNAGMTMCYEHLVVLVPMYQQYVKRGAKIIFAGAGPANYTDQEVKIVRKAMKEFPVYGLISRDHYTFEKYGDLAQHSYDGIDSALFIADCFQPVPLNLPGFDVMTFDSLDEPHINHEGRSVVRTHHTCWPPSLKPEYFKHPNTLISDLPSDYLTLYAQAKITYSDRVHACLAALAFGREARMYFRDGDRRIHMFQRLGVPEIYKMPVRLDLQRLIEEKEKQINFLRTILLEKTTKGTYAKNTQLADTAINITKQQIPECSILLLVTEKEANLCKAIDSILSQTCMDFNLFVVDFTPENVAKTVIEDYEDSRVHYVAKQTDIPLISIFEDISSKYVTCVSPDVIYEPYFLYELKKSLQEHPQAPLVYSDYRQIDRIGSGEVVNAEKVFNKKNNIGYCFLARKEAIGEALNSGITIFNNDNLYLPLVRDSLISYSPQILGNRHYRAGIYTSGLHILHKVMDVGRKEGWRVVVRKGMNFLRRFLGKRPRQLYKYSKKDWLGKAQTLGPNAWAKEYTDVWETFMNDQVGRDALLHEGNIEERIGMQLVLKEIKQNFPHNTSFLEVGGGTGEFSAHLAKMGYNIVCTDCNTKALEIGKDKIAYLSEETKNRIAFKEAFAENLPFPDNSFDGVVCMEVLEHLVDPQKAVSEFYRVLKDKGKVYITVPYRNFINSPLHIQEFTIESIRALFEEYFNVDCMKLCPFFVGQSNNQILLVGEKGD